MIGKDSKWFEYPKVVKCAQLFEHSMAAIRMLDFLFDTTGTAQWANQDLHYFAKAWIFCIRRLEIVSAPTSHFYSICHAISRSPPNPISTIPHRREEAWMQSIKLKFQELLPQKDLYSQKKAKFSKWIEARETFSVWNWLRMILLFVLHHCTVKPRLNLLFSLEGPLGGHWEPWYKSDRIKDFVNVGLNLVFQFFTFTQRSYA